MKSYKNLRPVWAEIDLDNIGHNISEFKNKLEDDTLLTVVVKADGYGHGAVQVAKTALHHGTDRLAVAILDEAIELREAGLKKVPLLILGWTPKESAAEVVKHDLIQTVYNYENVSALNKEAAKLNKKVKVHVKVDTGMGRIGLEPDEAVDFVKRIKKLSNIVVEGIYTHFAVADAEDKNYTYEQFAKFTKVITDLEDEGIDIPIKHSANSAAFLDLPETHLDMVRLGIITYGLWPSKQVQQRVDLKPGMRLKARIAYIKDVPKGTDISYGRTYTTESESKIATLPLGYEDGYNRLLSSNNEVLVNGKRVPVVGRVCMDQFMIDVSEIDSVEIGDEVTLIGKNGEEEITATEVADRIETINYEVVCMVSKRIPRVYVNNNEVVEVVKR
ncbi:alanine racemase [Selenihalanaerobacter shriftii]|uniref:Alanine racemase n=1 Tax=Selenihalanaerobacter shriftii TaxID=142842 RepID=A0A1T4NCT9_9FIRM|nr:alanine racemase [Selenihalanaerobacter shriftii]SJZ77112.1 alanine racemase [Selenihalanaerobacter shriftii]